MVPGRHEHKYFAGMVVDPLLQRLDEAGRMVGFGEVADRPEKRDLGRERGNDIGRWCEARHDNERLGRIGKVRNRYGDK